MMLDVVITAGLSNQEKKGRKLLTSVLALKRVDDPAHNFKFCPKCYTVEASQILPITVDATTVKMEVTPARGCYRRRPCEVE